MLDWIGECGPNLIVRFKVEAKIQTKTAWDGCLEIGIRSNTISASLQERPKMLQAGTCRDSEDLVAMEPPGKGVVHVHEWQKPRWLIMVEG
jgi:hypothetical protein